MQTVFYQHIHVEHFSKTGMKQWSFCKYDKLDEAIAFTKVPFQISLTDLYNKVQLEAKAIEGDRA
ncbi:hypothetical protein [Altericista sp. CCNU0014]|uniref:hypothetical protein n=1 Tax=Altericista sp. CCNU0014 TaxID=3082949 RepID=UPI0038500AF2